MQDNVNGRILNFLGKIILFFGIIGSLIIGGETESAVITIAGILSCVIFGMMLIGFGEVIQLLQKNADNQETLKNQLRNIENKLTAPEVKEAPKAQPAPKAYSVYQAAPQAVPQVVSQAAAPAAEQKTPASMPDPATLKNLKVPVKLIPDERGMVECPVCKNKQKGNRYRCFHCGTVFANGQTGVPFWCGSCGEQGPYEGDCPSCGSKEKIWNS